MRNRTEEALWNCLSYGGASVVLALGSIRLFAEGGFGLIPVGLLIFVVVFAVVAMGAGREFWGELGIDAQLRERYEETETDTEPEEPLKWREHPSLLDDR